MKLCLRCNQYFEDGIELCPMDTSVLEAVGEHPLIGALINDRYVVDSVIGKGSSGIVYKATRLLMGREVAVKVLHSYLGAEVGALDRFLREARAASRLRHPHIINIWESGVTDDAQPYFVMDYLEGLTLADLIRQKGYIHSGRAMPIITQICEALGEAHRQNIIHRDIKPENIVLETNEGDNNFTDYVKVLDFGIADAPAGTPGAPKQKTAAGSPAYMSPEQCQGFELDHRSDIYSLAVVIFEMLTGIRPFNADDVMKLFYMHVSQPPPTLSSMRADLRFPMQVELAVAKALAKNPDNRQQSIKEFQKELEEAFASSESAPSTKRERESVSVDLYSVPVVDRLTDGAGGITKTGNHNFLPGPEADWDESEALTPPQEANPAAPKSETPDVSAAVNRLLKSAKRASEAVKQEDVGSWARDVLNRNDGPEPVEQKEAPKPLKATGGQSPPADSGPEISNWAHKVLNRAQQTGEHAVPGQPNQVPTPAQAPAAKAPQQSPVGAKAPGVVPGKASSSAVPPGAGSSPAARAGGIGSSDVAKPGNKLGKQIDLLKAKSAADAARRANGEQSKSPDQMPSVSTPAPPAAKAPVIPNPDANRTLSLKSAEPPASSQSLTETPFGQPQSLDQSSFGGAPQTLDHSSFGAPPQSLDQVGFGSSSSDPSGYGSQSGSDFDLSSEIDDLLGEVLPPPTSSNVTPKEAPAAAKPDLPRTEPPKSAGMKPLPVKPPESAGMAKPQLSANRLPASASPQSSATKLPSQSSAHKLAPPSTPQSSMSSMPAARTGTPQSSYNQLPASTPPAVTPPMSNSAASISSHNLPAVDASTERGDKPSFDPSRFEQPVNKTAETLNPFAQAIDGLLDAAIMPKTQEDVRRSASKLKKMDAPDSPSASDLDRFEQPINTRSMLNADRFENPINKEALDAIEAPSAKPALDPSRFDQPVNKGFISGSTAGSKMLGASDAEKKLDPSRFDRPINQAEESLNPFAQAVDGLLDSARIKPDAQRMATSNELGETAAAVGKPPDAAAIEALDSTAEEDKVHDAVSRLIEAAKRSPEPVAKPEVLNKKIEAVKKKIEALKAQDVAKPVSSGVPPGQEPPAAEPAAPQAPFVPGPSDSNSLSDAVNRLLEAAQRETSTSTPVVPPQMANPFADAYSSPAAPASFGTSSGTNNPPAQANPFDAAASTAMVNPFSSVSQAPPPETTSSGTFKRSLPNAPNAPIGPVPPDPNKKPVEGSAFQNYVSAPTDRMTRAAELINNAIKSSKTPEVVQDYYSGYKNDPKQVQAERADNLKKGRARVRKNFQGPPRPPLWLAFLLALIVGGFAAWYFGFLPFIPMTPPKASAPLTVDGYVKQGRFDKAKELLEAKKKTGSLTPAESDKLNNLYYQIGLKEAKEENYQEAVKNLKQIPRKSDLYPNAAGKIREFKKKLNDL